MDDDLTNSVVGAALRFKLGGYCYSNKKSSAVFVTLTRFLSRFLYYFPRHTLAHRVIMWRT
jgi:hypothetical protein